MLSNTFLQIKKKNKFNLHVCANIKHGWKISFINILQSINYYLLKSIGIRIRIKDLKHLHTYMFIIAQFYLENCSNGLNLNFAWSFVSTVIILSLTCIEKCIMSCITKKSQYYSLFCMQFLLYVIIAHN